MASGSQVPAFVGLLIYLRFWLNKVGRKNFNTVVKMHGTPAALSYSRASGELDKECRKLQCTESLRWKNRAKEDAMLDSFEFSNLACFPAESCSQTPASSSAGATILAIAGFSSATSQCCCCSLIATVLGWVQSLSSPVPVPLCLLSPSAVSPLRATPPFDRDASGGHGKGMSGATSPILCIRKFSC